MYLFFSGPIFCLRNSFKIAARICQFNQCLGTKLNMLFKIAKSDEMVIISEKKNSLKILDFIQNEKTALLLPLST